LTLVALFCVLLILSNIIGLKFFYLPFIPSITLPCSLLTYPFTFLIGDLVTELFGLKAARFMLLLGFVFSLLMLLILQIAIHLPTDPACTFNGHFKTHLEYKRAFESIFGLSHIVVIASLVAYLCAQLIDVLLFEKIKQKTKGRFLFLRNNLSTWAAQGIDTLIVNGIILFAGLQMPFDLGLRIMSSSLLIKVIIAALETPILYLALYYLRRYVQPRMSKGSL
jgi:queuosine precursor transporter